MNTSFNRKAMPSRVNRTPRFALLCSLASLLLGSSAAMAQDNDDSDVLELDPFDVTSVATDRYLASNSISGTAMNTLLKDIPMTINVITNEFLEDAVIGDLERALDFNSSITQTTRGQISNQNSMFSLRGFRNRNILLDGVMGGDHIPRYLVDRIEVVKGPNTLYGQSDPGGLVNMISKRPQGKDRSSVTARFGSDATWGGDFDLNVAELAPDLGMRLFGSYSDTDGWRWIDHQEQSMLGGAFAWQATNTTKVRLLVSQANKNGIPTNRATYSFMRIPTDLNGDGVVDGTVVAGVREDTARYNNDFLPWEWTSETEQASRFDQDARYIQATIEQKINDAVSLQYNYINSKRENDVTFREFNTFNPAGVVTANNTTSYNLNETEAHTLNSFINVETGPMKHNLIAGIRYTDDLRYGESYRLRPTNGAELAILSQLEMDTGRTFRHSLTRDEILAGPPRIWEDDAPTREELRRLGPRTNQNGDNFEEVTTIYISDSIAMMEDRLRLLAGIRDIEIVGFGFNTSGVSNGPKRKSTDTSYQFGANYAINDSLVLFGNTATAFNPNGFNNDTGEFYDPESSEAYEIGAKLDGLFGGKLSGSVAWFQIDKENVVRSDFNPVTFVSDTEITDDRSEGFDVELFYNATPGWQITMGYTHLNARTVVSQTEALGLNLEGAAPDKLTMFTTYAIDEGPLNGLRFGGGFIKAWGPIQQFGTSGNRLVTEDGYTQVNIFARYRTKMFNTPTTFGLNVSNLTDEFFIRARANTGTPRQIVGSVRFDF